MLTPPSIVTEDSDPDGKLPLLEQRRTQQPLEVFLAGVSAAGVKYLLDFIYSSKLALSLANIQDVLSAASYLQVLQVVEACSNYLQVFCFYILFCFLMFFLRCSIFRYFFILHNYVLLFSDFVLIFPNGVV